MSSLTSHTFPSPLTRLPVVLANGSRHPGTVFLRAVLDHPQIEVGEYSYASTFNPPDDWARLLAPHLYDFSTEKLKIGKFCQIAHGVVFITASANHRYDGFSSYPFAVFDGTPAAGRPSMPAPGSDTVVGHDVWIGQGAMILPGTQLGNGVIVGAGAVVGGTVPDYAIVTGNPASVHRMRFDNVTIARLNELAWWHWPIERILEHEATIVGADLEAMERAAPQN